MDFGAFFDGASNESLKYLLFFVSWLLCLSFFLFLFKDFRRDSKDRKPSIAAWTDMAQELGVDVEKKVNFSFTKTYNMRYKGHVISLSVPDYFARDEPVTYKGILVFEPKMYFSIDHHLPGRIALSICDISNRQNVDEALNRYTFSSENEKKLLRDKILSLERGQISIRKGIIKHAEGPGYLSDKRQMREIVEKLVDLSDTLES